VAKGELVAACAGITCAKQKIASEIINIFLTIKHLFNSPLSGGLLNPETSGVDGAAQTACPELVEGGVFSTAQTFFKSEKKIL
jgi:hypothetical protein